MHENNVPFIASSHPIHYPIDILGAVSCLNVLYVFLIGYQSQRYERRPIIGNVCFGIFNESVAIACLVWLYSVALALIVRDVWVNLGSDLGLSLIILLFSWVPLRILCPFYQFTDEELNMYASSVSILNPRSWAMCAFRLFVSAMEVITVSWLCVDLYTYSESYKPASDLYHSVRLTALVSSAVLCIGCNIWWCLAAVWLNNAVPDELDASKLHERLLSGDDNMLYTPSFILTELKLTYSLLFHWFTPTLQIGYNRLLQIADLPNLPSTMKSQHGAAQLGSEAEKHIDRQTKRIQRLSMSEHDNDTWLNESDTAAQRRASRVLVSIFWNCFGNKFIVLGIIKLLNCLASFAGPLILGAMVNYVENDASVDTLGYGLFLVAMMGVSFLLSATLNTANNVRGGVLQISVKGALTKLLFARAMNLPVYAWNDVGLTDAKLTTLVQVDVDRVSDALKSLHDLWALPLQLAIAFYVLYDEV
jgi:hypothetical protein